MELGQSDSRTRIPNHSVILLQRETLNHTGKGWEVGKSRTLAMAPGCDEPIFRVNSKHCPQGHAFLCGHQRGAYCLTLLLPPAPYPIMPGSPWVLWIIPFGPNFTNCLLPDICFPCLLLQLILVHVLRPDSSPFHLFFWLACGRRKPGDLRLTFSPSAESWKWQQSFQIGYKRSPLHVNKFCFQSMLVSPICL